mgnify:CR=1 FL=1
MQQPWQTTLLMPMVAPPMAVLMLLTVLPELGLVFYSEPNYHVYANSTATAR